MNFDEFLQVWYYLNYTKVCTNRLYAGYSALRPCKNEGNDAENIETSNVRYGAKTQTVKKCVVEGFLGVIGQ